MDERQGKHFNDDNGVIRMTDVAIRAGGDDCTGGSHDLRIPLLAETAPHPDASDHAQREKSEHCPSKKSDKWPREQPDFNRTAEQKTSMHPDHERICWFDYFLSAFGEQLGLMTARHDQLCDAEQ